MNLSVLGWNAHFARHFEAFGADHFLPARVIRQDKQRYLVRHADGDHSAVLLGKLLHADADSATIPAVGDWVAIELFDDDQAVIHAVLPRQSAFTRKVAGTRTRQQVIAANIDTVFLVCGLDHDFNLRRIERYVVQAAGSGARAVLLLNKSDACEDVPMHVREATRVAPGMDVLALSARTGEGMAALRGYLATGKTVALLGSSGVGKSTLVNALIGSTQLATQSVREDDSRGRHTTTRRELFVLPTGGILIDTPGLRELQLWSDETDLSASFPDIEALAARCRFRDCSHESEPGCAVQGALASGQLDEDRFLSHLKLRRELAYLERRMDEAAQFEERRREKQFGKLRKQVKRNSPKR